MKWRNAYTPLLLVYTAWAFFGTIFVGGADIGVVTDGKVKVTGDADISPDSMDGIFGTMDNDRNGEISIDEMRDFVVNTGGASLDDLSEIQNAVDNVFSSLDENEDKVDHLN